MPNLIIHCRAMLHLLPQQSFQETYINLFRMLIVCDIEFLHLWETPLIKMFTGAQVQFVLCHCVRGSVCVCKCACGSGPMSLKVLFRMK